MLNSIYLLSVQSMNDDQLRTHKENLQNDLQTIQKKLDYIKQIQEEKLLSKQTNLFKQLN